jgi:hypothetical protein
MDKDESRIFIRRFLVLLSVSFVIFVCVVYYNFRYVYPKQMRETEKLNQLYFDNFNYSFSGIVTNYYENRNGRGNHLGVVTLNLKHSDIDFYDPSDTTNIYFCTVKDNVAKVLIPVQYELERIRNTQKYKSIVSGDSLAFNGQKDNFTLYFDNDSISWTPLTISTDSENRDGKVKYIH